MSASSYADPMQTHASVYSQGQVTFGCNNGHYTVTIDNFMPEVEYCSVTCRSHFHSELSSVVVNPNSSAFIQGNFGLTNTSCTALCNGQVYGPRATVSVGGFCGL